MIGSGWSRCIPLCGRASSARPSAMPAAWPAESKGAYRHAWARWCRDMRLKLRRNLPQRSPILQRPLRRTKRRSRLARSSRLSAAALRCNPRADWTKRSPLTPGCSKPTPFTPAPSRISVWRSRRRDRLRKQLALYRRALLAEPTRLEARNNLGNALLRMGKIDEAIAEYRQALRLDPAYANAYFNLGNAFRSQGDLDAAAVRLSARPSRSGPAMRMR